MRLTLSFLPLLLTATSMMMSMSVEVTNAEDTDAIISRVESLLEAQRHLVPSKKTTTTLLEDSVVQAPAIEQEKPRFQQVKKPTPPTPPVFRDFSSVSNPPYMNGNNMMRFATQNAGVLPGGIPSSNAEGFVWQQQQQQQQQPPFPSPSSSPAPLYMDPHAAILSPGSFPNAEVHHPLASAPPHQEHRFASASSRFVTAPEGGVPPPMSFSEISSRVSSRRGGVRDDDILDLETQYRQASGVRTNNAVAGDGRATYASREDNTNVRVEDARNFQTRAGTMPAGENDRGAVAFEFSAGKPTTRMQQTPSNLRTMRPMASLPSQAKDSGGQQTMRFRRAETYAPAARPAPARGMPRLYSTPIGPDIQQKQSRGNDADASKRAEIAKYEAWKKMQDASAFRFKGNAEAVESVERRLSANEKKRATAPVRDKKFGYAHTA